MVQYNYSKMIGRMAELGITKGGLAKKMHIGRVTLYEKMRSNRAFTQNEIESGIQALGLDKKDIPLYFFTNKKE